MPDRVYWSVLGGILGCLGVLRGIRVGVTVRGGSCCEPVRFDVSVFQVFQQFLQHFAYGHHDAIP